MRTERLRSIPLFSSLPEGEIAYLATTLTTRQFAEKSILLYEGGADDHFYILLEGQVEIIKSLGKPDERVLGVRESGTLLGEMSLFTPNGTHTASVRASTELMILEMTRADFDALLHRQPGLAYEVIGLISRRLDESENLTILDLREKNRQLTQAYLDLKAAQAQIIEKERLEHELQIARGIQRSILPQTLPKIKDYDLGALMIPARAVGGDFYDFIQLGEGLWGVVVGDVSDKGVPAALFMGLSFSLIRAEASRLASPAETLRAVNQHLLGINATNMFVTLVYGVLNCHTGCFNYARAGHLPPFILDKEGKLLPISHTAGQCLGLFPELILDEREVELPIGGMLLVFSDGLSEAMNLQGEDFNSYHLQEALKGLISVHAQGVCDGLFEAVKNFSNGLPQADDFTVVVVQRKQG